MEGFFTLVILISSIKHAQGLEGTLTKKNFRHFHRHRLNVTATQTKEHNNEMLCIRDCLKREDCHSFNSKPIGNSKILCEFLNTSKYQNYDNLTKHDEYTHWFLEDPCAPNPCKYDGTCVNDKFELTGSRCDCTAGLSGKHCDVFKSCKLAFSLGNQEDGAYKIQTENDPGYAEIYCLMTPLTGCSDAGWTTVMKINGSKATFEYDSPYWTNTETYNVAGGRTAFDYEETKLPTYTTVPFNSLCIAMKVDNVLRSMEISYTADSLYNVIADDVFHETNVNTDAWKSLIPSSSLQVNCLKQGFNVEGLPTSSATRVGIFGNNENNCDTPDSYIGAGGKVFREGHICSDIPTYPDVHVAGNSAFCAADNSDKYIKAMAYIFVK